MATLRVFIMGVTLLLWAGFACGQTWTQTIAPSSNWFSIASSADGTKLTAVVYVPRDPNVAPSSPIYVSTNSGISWTPTGPFENDYPNSNWGEIAASADGTKLLVSSTFDPLYVSTDAGISWHEDGPLNGNLASIYWAGVASSADGNKFVAAVFFGGNFIYVSTNSGSTWTPTSASTVGQGWSSVASSSDGRHLAATTDFDTIYISTNSGMDWSATTAPLAIWSSIATSCDGSELVATAYNNGYGGFLGSIYHSADSGKTWSVTTAPSNSWQSVASSADGTKLVAAFNGGPLYTSTDSGSTWNPANVPSTNWQCVAMSADGNTMVATVQGGGIWVSHITPSPQLNVTVSPFNVMLSWIVPSTSFVLQESTDLVSWEDVTNQPVLNLTNLQNQVTLSPSKSGGFYRLKTP